MTISIADTVVVAIATSWAGWMSLAVIQLKVSVARIAEHVGVNGNGKKKKR